MAAPADPTGIDATTLELAKELLARRSITPADGGCLDVVATRLRAAGFTCERIDRGAVVNLWATHGRGTPRVCLAGHVDVVPPGPVDRWTSDPFTPVERDGYLVGRGAADMKVSVAATVTAAERFVAANPSHNGTLALLLTSDEEGDALDGTLAVVEALQSRGERLDACLIGEPTSSERLGDTIKHGRRGSLHGVLHIRGVQCHIAYPEKGRNPIHEALPALDMLTEELWDTGNEAFEPTSFQISNIHAGTGVNNIIPGTLEVQFNFRFSPESEYDWLEGRVREILDDHRLDYTARFVLGSQPFVSAPGALVAALGAAVVQVTGLTAALSTTGGTSDGRFLTAISDEVAEFGPVNRTIHALDERVRLADIGPLSVIYEQTVAELLS